MSESDILELLSIERTNLYQKKKEAIKLFGIALWGYALPQYKKIFENSYNENSEHFEGINANNSYLFY